MRLAMIAQLLSWLNRVDESGTMNNDYAWCPMLEYQRTFGVVDTDGAGWNEQGDELCSDSASPYQDKWHRHPQVLSGCRSGK